MVTTGDTKHEVRRRVRRVVVRWSVRAFAAGFVGALALAGPAATVHAGALTFGAVTGRVTDGSGHGVSGLRVGVPATGNAFTTTDGNGNYVVANVPTASSRYDVVLLAGCGRDQTKQVVVDGVKTVNFTVGAAVKIAGYTCSASPQAYIYTSSIIQQPGDDFAFAAGIGFDFSYFGAKRDDYVTFDSNGELTLPQTGQSFYSNQPLPQSDAPNGVIAPFWDDLVWDSTSRFGTERGGAAPNRYAVFEWRDVLFHDGAPGERVSFEVILYENGRIVFNYDGISTDPAHARERGSSATVGIESPDGTRAVARSYNQPLLDNGFAIQFTPAPK